MACSKLTANRILVLKEGKVGAEGAFEELEKSEDKDVRAFFQ
jgi:phospholipid/cholesterol/gamma-HCH transport system ATP-binding protein